MLLARRVIGNQVVDALVKNPSNKPAAHDACWSIGYDALYDIGAALVVYGLVFVVAAWLAGHTRPAAALRRALAPTLRTSPAVAYVVVAAGCCSSSLGPTPATRQIAYIIGFAFCSSWCRSTPPQDGPSSSPTRKPRTRCTRSAPGTPAAEPQRRRPPTVVAFASWSALPGSTTADR